MQKLKLANKMILESDTKNKDEISVPLILNDEYQINLTLPNSKNAKGITDAPIVFTKDGSVIVNKSDVLKFFKLIGFSTT